MNKPSDENIEYSTLYARRQIDRANSPFRKRVRALYINSLLKHIVGPTIDMGCGAGQVLEKLPTGSIGLEINKSLLLLLKARGLNVEYYNGYEDDFRLSIVGFGQFETLLLSHVLEHFIDAEHVIPKIWSAASKLGVKKIVVALPGKVGFASDETHRTFIDEVWVRKNNFTRIAGFELSNVHYFPVNSRLAGDYFIYNEMRLIYSLVD